MTDPAADGSALLDLALRAARGAGTELLSRYGRIEGLATKSSSTDPVSDADRAAEQLLVELIRRERPDDGLISEEGATRPSRSGITWVIDPLDGTVNYLYELGNFSVSIAAEDADGAIVGVVHDPASGRTFAAVRGAGAIGDGQRLQVLREVMERQVNHMVRLVDDLLEVSRITRGKIDLRRQPLELAEAVHGAVETIRPAIEAARHELSVQLPQEPVLLDADPVRFGQVLGNLLNNAAKYTADGGRIWLDVTCEGAQAVLTVRDSGAGIPADMLPEVFDLFTQVERTYCRSKGGLGIGLTLARSLVNLHGGTIEARSQGPGKGSEFVVRWPLAEGSQPAVAEPPREATTLARRILVVDDNRDSADTLSQLLQLLGAEVRTAYDGEEALAAFSAYRPSVVLLDIGLPDIDGYEVARRAREQSHGVTLIALTGWGQEDDRRRSKAAGIDHHLLKPVDFGALERVLAALPAA